MVISITLAILGLLLIFLEFFVPGGILASLGALLCLAGVIAAYIETENPATTLIFLLSVIALIILTCKLALKTLPRMRGANYVAQGDQEGYVASEFDKSLIGKEGVVKTVLRPNGEVQIGDIVTDAQSLSGYLAKGTKIRVLGGEGSHVKVEKIEEES